MASSSGCALGEDASCLPAAAEKGASVWRSEAPRTDQRFPRSCRLTARRQFLAVYERGRRVSTASFLMFALPNTAGICRLGLTVTRKVGPAHARNRVKRVFREIFRRHRQRLSPALDLVINPRPVCLARPVAELEREFLDGFARLARRYAP